MAKTPKAPRSLNVLGFRRRGFEVTRTPSAAAFSALGLFQTVQGSTPAQTGFDFYIATNGSDSNNGLTPATPWAITALNTKRSTYAGKIVGLLDGTYNLFSTLTDGSHTSVDTWALDVDGGTNGAPTIIKAVNPLGATITGKSGSTYGNASAGGTPLLGHSGTTTHRGYVVFDGLIITGVPRLGIRVGIYGAGSQIPGVVVKNCEFTDFRGTALPAGLNLECLEINNCTGAQIQNNYFHDNVGYAVGAADHLSCILVWLSDRTIIEYNTSVAAGAIYGKENGNYGTTIRYNYVDTSSFDITGCIQDFAGIHTDPATFDTLVYNNVLIGAQTINMIYTLSDAEYIASNAYVYNNTCVMVASAASRGIRFKADAGKLKCYNNIIVDQASGDHSYIAVNVDGVSVVDYNLFYTSGSPIWSTYASKTATSRDNTSSFTTYKATVSGDSHGISGSDPLFVGTGTLADRYQLQSGSPARNAGKTGGVVGGSTVHIGAWDGIAARIGYDSTVRM
jgi:Right handed beta helix region